MKAVSLTPFSTVQETCNGGHLLPAGTWKPTGYEPELIQTEHPFLQQLLENRMPIFKCQGELTIHAERSMIWLKVYEDHIRIEYIVTYNGKRWEKYGTNSMKKLCAIADATHTTLRLTTDVITLLLKEETGLGQPSLRLTTDVITHLVLDERPIHPVLIHATQGKCRIPAPDLVKWFEAFGFVKGERSTNQYIGNQSIDYQGYHMERSPKSTKE